MVAVNLNGKSHSPQLVAPGRVGAIESLYRNTPAPGEAIEVASGIWWLRLPLDSALDHINVYVLADRDGWTLVDTGSNTPICRQALENAFDRGVFAQQPLVRVIVTHYHPDHIGLAGLLSERGAGLHTTQSCWLHSRLLQMDRRDLPCDEEIRFFERVGMKGLELEAFIRKSPSNYPDLVLPIPYSYQRIQEGDRLKIGKRYWRIHLGYGHATEHATLWSDDGFVITGDQVLPGMSSNLSVHPSQPDADLVSEWVASCWRFARLATDDSICLPGHNIPFKGIPTRCEQIIASQAAVLNRLLDFLTKPRTAIECLEAVYRRQLQPHEREISIAETVGFLNHLYQRGTIARELTDDRVYLWYRTNPRDRDLRVHFDPNDI